MRKVTASFATALFVVAGITPLWAQGPVPSATIGLKAGINVASLSIEDAGDEVDTSTRTAFAIGAAIGINVGPIFTIQPELFYSLKGAKVDDPSVDVTVKVNYIEIPVLAKFNVPTPSNVRPTFFAGPYVAFEASCTVGAEGGGVTVDVSCDDFGVDRKSTDIGLVGGAGLEVDVGSIILTFEGRYGLGLTNLADTGDDTDSIKSRNIQGLVGIAFKLPRRKAGTGG